MVRKVNLRKDWVNKNQEVLLPFMLEPYKSKFLEGELGAKDDAEWVCEVHGRYKQRLGRHTGCPKCRKKYHPIKKETKDKKLKEWYEEHKEAFKDITEDSLKEYWSGKDKKSKFDFLCPIHGIYKQDLAHRVFSNSRCPHCSKSNNEFQINRRRVSFIEKYKELLKDMDPVDFQKLYDGELKVHDRAWFICQRHGRYYQSIKNHVYPSELNSCPFCVQGTYRSKLEKEISSLLEGWSIGYYHNIKSVLGRYELDIYIPEKSIGIEVNGCMYHGSLGPQSYKVDKLKPNDYHLQKFIEAERKGVRLIQIFDIDWYRNKEKIVTFLSDLLNPVIVIGARKTKIKEISIKDANEFFSKNHLQGFTRHSTKNLALIYKDEIVACMGFGKPRFNRWVGVELHRFAYKNGCVVIGGAEKLFKYFTSTTKSRVLSYSDNDWFQGKLYQRLGFEFSGFTNPRYFWIKGKDYLTREECMIHKLKEKYPELYREAVGNKEDYIMIKLGYTKVYRSGNKKWIYNR